LAWAASISAKGDLAVVIGIRVGEHLLGTGGLLGAGDLAVAVGVHRLEHGVRRVLAGMGGKSAWQGDEREATGEN